MNVKDDDMKQEVITKALEKISGRYRGKLTPAAVVEDARDKRSPLHHYFTWNDSEAAEQWRLEQARQLIRSVKITVNIENRSVSTFCYVRDPKLSTNEQGYISLVHVRTDNEMKIGILLDEFERLKSIFNRILSIAEVLQMADGLGEILTKIEDAETKFKS